jgi:multiple sugar transport system permease protein
MTTLSTSAGSAIRDQVGPADRARRGYAGRGLLLTSPALLFVLVFVLFPLAFAVYMSLTNWPLIGPFHFVGVRNYAQIGQDAVFGASVRFTLIYTGIVTVPILVVGYALAVLVRANRVGVTALRTAFFLPFVVGLTTESFMVYLELQPKTGAVNFVLEKLGLTDGSTGWLVNSVPAITAVCVLVVWSASGLTMMLLMAGMQGIPQELYESAEVDGASWWTRELRITLPMLRRTIALSLIISVVGSFLAFNQFFILTQGGPDVSTTTVVMWIYEKAFVQLHVGAATALSIILVVAVGLISLVQFLLLRDRESEA